MTFEMRCEACQKVVAENEVRYDALWCSTRCSKSNRCSHIHLNMMGVCVGCGHHQGARKGVVCAGFRPTMALLKTGGAGPSEVCLLCSYHRGLHGWKADEPLARPRKTAQIDGNAFDWNAYHGFTRRHDDG